jgi:hypothetical protein
MLMELMFLVVDAWEWEEKGVFALLIVFYQVEEWIEWTLSHGVWLYTIKVWVPFGSSTSQPIY